jgi:putative membrane protein insertion efficiency factor
VGGAKGGAGQRSAASAGPLARGLAGAVKAPILLYQRFVSPALPRRCKYEPTCSRYAVQALGEYGILRGLALAAWRLLRCNPWSHGGYDPVEAQRLFKTSPTPDRRRRV